jgi:GNAT superfamily N-acetyltransferase
VIATDADPDWVRAQLPPGDLSAPLNPPFLNALCARTGRRVNSVDLVTVAPSLPGPPELQLGEVTGSDHPRVRRARRYRDDVRVWALPGGVLILSRGVAGRWELAMEVDEPARGRGLGRALVAAARHLVPDGALLWAQVAPGNAASVRAVLAAGLAPIGAEALLVPLRTGDR